MPGRLTFTIRSLAGDIFVATMCPYQVARLCVTEGVTERVTENIHEVLFCCSDETLLGCKVRRNERSLRLRDEASWDVGCLRFG